MPLVTPPTRHDVTIVQVMTHPYAAVRASLPSPLAYATMGFSSVWMLLHAWAASLCPVYQSCICEVMEAEARFPCLWSQNLNAKTIN